MIQTIELEDKDIINYNYIPKFKKLKTEHTVQTHERQQKKRKKKQNRTCKNCNIQNEKIHEIELMARAGIPLGGT